MAIYIIAYYFGESYNKYCAYLYISNFLFRLKAQEQVSTVPTQNDPNSAANISNENLGQGMN